MKTFSNPTRIALEAIERLDPNADTSLYEIIGIALKAIAYSVSPPITTIDAESSIATSIAFNTIQDQLVLIANEFISIEAKRKDTFEETWW
jgi:hypothetical protein